MKNNLSNLTEEFSELEAQLADPAVLSDQGRYRSVMQRYSELRPIVLAQQEVAELLKQIGDARTLLNDPELAEVAREELAELEPRLEAGETRLERLLLPGDPFDSKNVIVELRAAAGGGEASLFAAEVLNMYLRYAAELGYRTELLDSHSTEVGGFSRVSFQITGTGAYSHFKFESGVHRVQRVPETETQGRIHTSTITVAVMPEAEDVDVNLVPADYRVDVFRSSGPGGQSVNTTDSAVRVTYRPGTPDEIIVTCQDGKSQLKNREQALTVLRSRLLEREREKAAAEQRETRLVQIGGGDRSEKIRTYNFPQSRVTDHRIGFNSRNLTQIMQGDLSELTSALTEAEQARRLAEIGNPPAGPAAGEPA
jgi:peptide chain release factor 1